MKRVFILRHAKSSWSDPALADYERPLTKRGRSAAQSIGRALARIGQVPDAVYSSSAVRARDTVTLAAKAGAWSCAVGLRKDFYDAAPGVPLRFLATLDDRLRSVLIAGHEPTCSELVALLTGGTNVRMPTAALVRLDLLVDRWAQVGAATAALVWLLTPKLVDGLG